jgi:hypothetical protein
VEEETRDRTLSDGSADGDNRRRVRTLGLLDAAVTSDIEASEGGHGQYRWGRVAERRRGGRSQSHGRPWRRRSGSCGDNGTEEKQNASTR